MLKYVCGAYQHAIYQSILHVCFWNGSCIIVLLAVCQEICNSGLREYSFDLFNISGINSLTFYTVRGFFIRLPDLVKHVISKWIIRHLIPGEINQEGKLLVRIQDMLLKTLPE
jgi:hypothetical protein